MKSETNELVDNLAAALLHDFLDKDTARQLLRIVLVEIVEDRKRCGVKGPKHLYHETVDFIMEELGAVLEDFG